MTIISELDIIDQPNNSSTGSPTSTITQTGLSSSGSGDLSGTIAGSFGTLATDATGEPGLTAITLDTPNDIFFLGFTTSTDTGIYLESFGQSSLTLNTLISVAKSADNGSIFGQVQGIDLDLPDSLLYFTAGDFLEEATFSGAGYAGTLSPKTLATIPNHITNSFDQETVAGAAIDTVNHLAYVAATSNSIQLQGFGSSTIGATTGNYIYKITGLNSSANTGAIAGSISISEADGAIDNIAFDTANSTVYFVTKPYENGTNAVSGIFALSESNNAITKIWAETASSSAMLADPAFTDLSIDPATGDYYLVDNNGIYEGNISSTAAPTLEVSVANNAAIAIAIDDAPTVSGVSVKAIDGSTSRTSGEAYTGDTITLAVTFSGAMTVSGTPSLTLDDGASAAYASGIGTDILDFTYTVASGQNTSTLAITNDTGTYADTDKAPLNGSIAGTFASLGIDTTPPTLALTGTSTEPLQGATTSSSPITNAVINDPDGTGTLTGALVTLIDSVSGDSFGISGASTGTVDGGAISYSEAGGVLTLAGTAALAGYEAALEAVTFQDDATQNTSHPTLTVSATVKEVSLSSTAATDLIIIDHAPVAASGGFSATLAAGASLSGTAPGLLTGDTDADSDTLFVTSISNAGGTVNAGISSFAGSFGTISLLDTGAYTYTAGDLGAINAAADGSTPTDDFTITISDDHGGLTTENVAFDIVRAPTIAAGGTVTAHQSYAVTIDSTATVTDPDGASITGATIDIGAGFLAGDTLSVTGTGGVASSYDGATGVLSLTGTAAAAVYQSVIDDVVFYSTAADPSDAGADLDRTIDYQVTDVAGLSSTAAASTVMISAIPCFAAGTRLLAAQGDVAVEDIKVGDMLLTVREGGPLTRRVVWTGRRTLDISRHADPAEVRPIRICAGAMGPGIPEVDLRVSPRHALYLDGALFEACSLVNGTSIYQESHTRFVTYHHIELDGHDIVLAEGLPCESYLDHGNRHEFEGEAALALHPNFAASQGALCAPLIQEGPRLAQERRRLAARIEAVAS